MLIDACNPIVCPIRVLTRALIQVRFENKSPAGDRSVFIDDVRVCRVGSATGVDVTTAQSSQAMCAAGWYGGFVWG